MEVILTINENHGSLSTDVDISYLTNEFIDVTTLTVTGANLLGIPNLNLCTFDPQNSSRIALNIGIGKCTLSFKLKLIPKLDQNYKLILTQRLFGSGKFTYQLSNGELFTPDILKGLMKFDSLAIKLLGSGNSLNVQPSSTSPTSLTVSSSIDFSNIVRVQKYFTGRTKVASMKFKINSTDFSIQSCTVANNEGSFEISNNKFEVTVSDFYLRDIASQVFRCEVVSTSVAFLYKSSSSVLPVVDVFYSNSSTKDRSVSLTLPYLKVVKTDSHKIEVESDILNKNFYISNIFPHYVESISSSCDKKYDSNDKYISFSFKKNDKCTIELNNGNTFNQFLISFSLPLPSTAIYVNNPYTFENMYLEIATVRNGNKPSLMVSKINIHHRYCVNLGGKFSIPIPTDTETYTISRSPYRINDVCNLESYMITFKQLNNHSSFNIDLTPNAHVPTPTSLSFLPLPLPTSAFNPLGMSTKTIPVKCQAENDCNGGAIVWKPISLASDVAFKMGERVPSLQYKLDFSQIPDTFDNVNITFASSSAILECDLHYSSEKPKSFDPPSKPDSKGYYYTKLYNYPIPNRLDDALVICNVYSLIQTAEAQNHNGSIIATVVNLQHSFVEAITHNFSMEGKTEYYPSISSLIPHITNGMVDNKPINAINTQFKAVMTVRVMGDYYFEGITSLFAYKDGDTNDITFNNSIFIDKPATYYITFTVASDVESVRVYFIERYSKIVYDENAVHLSVSNQVLTFAPEVNLHSYIDSNGISTRGAKTCVDFHFNNLTAEFFTDQVSITTHYGKDSVDKVHYSVDLESTCIASNTFTYEQTEGGLVKLVKPASDTSNLVTLPSSCSLCFYQPIVYESMIDLVFTFRSLPETPSRDIPYLNLDYHLLFNLPFNSDFVNDDDGVRIVPNYPLQTAVFTANIENFEGATQNLYLVYQNMFQSKVNNCTITYDSQSSNISHFTTYNTTDTKLQVVGPFTVYPTDNEAHLNTLSCDLQINPKQFNSTSFSSFLLSSDKPLNSKTPLPTSYFIPRKIDLPANPNANVETVPLSVLTWPASSNSVNKQISKARSIVAKAAGVDVNKINLVELTHKDSNSILSYALDSEDSDFTITQLMTLSTGSISAKFNGGFDVTNFNIKDIENALNNAILQGGNDFNDMSSSAIIDQIFSECIAAGYGCGDLCAPCTGNDPCKSDFDCFSGVCSFGLCVAFDKGDNNSINAIVPSSLFFFMVLMVTFIF